MIEKKEMQSVDTTVKLWAHEVVRVLGDRLVNDKDRLWMLEAIKDCVKTPFNFNFDQLFKCLDTDKDGKVDSVDEFRGLMFGDIYTPFGMTERPYEEINDLKRLKLSADTALENFNGVTDKPMNSFCSTLLLSTCLGSAALSGSQTETLCSLV